MAKYADGFVIPIPTRNLPAYWKMARAACKVWKDHGALEYFECVGDDLEIKFGVPFPKLAKARRGETVVFSWILYKSRAHRNAVNKRVMKDPRIQAMISGKRMPFDMKRLTCGGFGVKVEG